MMRFFPLDTTNVQRPYGILLPEGTEVTKGFHDVFQKRGLYPDGDRAIDGFQKVCKLLAPGQGQTAKTRNTISPQLQPRLPEESEDCN